MGFFVSTSATTSTLQTASLCFASLAATPACTGRKRRAISLAGMQPKEAVEGESVQQAESSLNLNEKRDGRFLLYWITTTSISTSTSFTITYSVSSVGCTAPGSNLCA